jgi:hypothetical protein
MLRKGKGTSCNNMYGTETAQIMKTRDFLLEKNASTCNTCYSYPGHNDECSLFTFHHSESRSL